MSNSSLMSIAEMIDNAFGEADANIVNFKLIQTVLYLLARQLRILERKVKVEIEIDRGPSKTNLSVTEVKIRATVPIKKKRIIKPGPISRAEEEKKGGNLPVKSSKSKPISIKEERLLPIDKSMSEKSFENEKTSSKSTEKSTLDKSSTTKSTDKSSSEKTKSTEKTSTEKSSTEKSTEKSSTEKSSTEKSSTEKSSTEKSSTEKSSTDKTSTDKTTSSSKKTASSKDTSDKTASSESKEKDLHKLLELIEEQRERELRIIHQRADSRDVGEMSPTPMASLDSVEERYEKLLVVERIPAGATRSSIGKQQKGPQLSIVTQNQFEALADVVRELQNRYKAAAMPDFPDNVQLMQDLRRGASLTDAMAALQLSARLDAAEKTLKQMLELVTDLAVKSGMETEIESKEVPRGNVMQEAPEISTPFPSRASKKSVASKPSKQPGKSLADPSTVDSVHVSMQSSEPSKIDAMPTPSSLPGTERDKVAIPMDYITYEDLDSAIESVVDGLMNTITGLTTRSNTNAENAIKLAKKLEEKLESSLNLGNRMNDLELLVSDFSEQINILDTSLSSQMTNYQEQLTQMQHDLEAGLEAMAEALANTGGDTAAVAELNTHFTNLQADVDVANMRQKELQESQNNLSYDLQALWQQIELLRGSKADRDEVEDALRDKADLGALNGLVSLEQFHAVQGDFEKRIRAAYDKFNNQEITWQKAIDDLLRELNDKADWIQLVALRDDVNKNFEMLRGRVHALLEIVGEPRSAAVTRRLFRDAACLSCSSPAHMTMEERDRIPQLPQFPKSSPRPPTIGAEDLSKPAEDGDHKICYPNLPIPHPIDPRAHICQRYCGGSHTLVTDKKGRTPAGLSVSPALRRTTTGIGSDGKTYMMEEAEPVKKPCIPCNEKNIYTPQPSEAEPVQEEFGSDMTTLDFLPPFHSQEKAQSDISVTPPPPIDDY